MNDTMESIEKIDEFRISYDWLFDILYISLVKNEPSVSEENINGIVTRRSIESNILTGITILDLKKRLKENKCITNTESEKKYMSIPFDEFKKVCKWYDDICSKENVKCSNDTCHVLRTIDENNKAFSLKIRTKQFSAELEEIVGLYEQWE